MLYRLCGRLIFLTAVLLTVLAVRPSLSWSAEGLQVQLLDANGQAIEVHDEKPAASPKTLDEFIAGARQDPLKHRAAFALAASLAGLLLFLLLPRWGFLDVVKNFGLVFSLIAALLTGAALFKIETDPAFYDQIYGVWRIYRPHHAPSTPPGVLVWVRGEADRRYLIFENAGLRFPLSQRYTLHKISEISRAVTPVSVASSEAVMTWKELDRLRKKYEQRNEFVLVPHKRSVFKIDLKREAPLSDAAMRKVRDHAYQEKARLERLNPGSVSASTSFQHYYTDGEENIIGSLKDVKGSDVKSGIWEDATGYRQIYAVPYMLVEQGDPEIAFWILKDTGAKESWDAYVAALPAEMKPYLSLVWLWLSKNMFNERHFRKGEIPSEVLQQVTFQFTDKSQLHFTFETWQSWLAMLENI